MVFGRRGSSVTTISSLRRIAARAFSSSSSPFRGIHVFKCPDAVGIVAKLSDCIASRGGNIHSVDVFVPENKQVFYSRSEFVFDPLRWPRDVIDSDFLKLSKIFSAQKSLVRFPDLDPKYKIAVLASGQDHCLVDLLHRWQEGRLPVDISCIISNHNRAPNTHVIRFLERHGIPYHYLPTTSGNKREQEILELVEETDFLVLARYMQILSGKFLQTYDKDIINIHHGLLPSFRGGNPSKQVDRVSHRDTLQSFVMKSENLEKQCLAQAMKSYCELRVLPYESNRTVVF